MTESDVGTKKKSLRRRVGKAILLLGVYIVIMSLVAMIIVSATPYVLPEDSIINWGGFGVLILIFGLILLLYPEGHTKDEAWIMQVTPFVGTN